MAKYVVKIDRVGYTTILFIGDKVEAKRRASDLNTMYQTNEYYVEKYKQSKLKLF